MPFDVSAIPTPDALQEVEYENYVDQMIEKLKLLNNQFTSTKESDPVYSVLQSIAYVVALKVQEINDAVRSVLLLTSQGADLDNLGVIYNEQRRTLVEGDNTVNPPIEPILESDTNYRNRLLSAFSALALGSSEWYRKLILEASSPFETTVNDMTVLGPEDSTDDLTIPNGEVWCYIEAISNTNPIPSSSLISDVQNYLDSNTLPGENDPREQSLERRFLGDTIRVYSCIQKPYTIQATITEIEGLDRETVRVDVQSKADQFVLDYKRIGQKIPLSAIYAALNTDQVFELDIEYPKSNIELQKNELPIASIVFELDANDYVTGVSWLDFSDETESKWSIIENNSKWNIVFSSGISGSDLVKLQGVGPGRKFKILTNSDEEKLSLQTVGILETSEENANTETHYYLELTEEPTLTDMTAGKFKISFQSAVEIL